MHFDKLKMVFLETSRLGMLRLVLRPMAVSRHNLSIKPEPFLSRKINTISSVTFSSQQVSSRDDKASLYSVTPQSVTVEGKIFPSDSWTNVTPRILSHLERKIHLKPDHPLGLIKARIVEFMYQKYRNHRGNPLFSVHDNLSPGNFFFRLKFGTC